MYCKNFSTTGFIYSTSSTKMEDNMKKILLALIFMTTCFSIWANAAIPNSSVSVHFEDGNIASFGLFQPEHKTSFSLSAQPKYLRYANGDLVAILPYTPFPDIYADIHFEGLADDFLWQQPGHWSFTKESAPISVYGHPVSGYFPTGKLIEGYLLEMSYEPHIDMGIGTLRGSFAFQSGDLYNYGPNGLFDITVYIPAYFDGRIDQDLYGWVAHAKGDIAPVPEPATLAMFFLSTAFAALAGFKRKRTV
jgi:hypothetical protein